MDDESLFYLLLYYRRCWELDICCLCEDPLGNRGMVCPMCKLFSYCSHECLEADLLQHMRVCIFILQAKQDERITHVMNITARIKSKARLLNSEGDFISSDILYDAYLVRGLNWTSRFKSTFLPESEGNIGKTIDIPEDTNKSSSPGRTENGASFPVSNLKSGCFGICFSTGTQSNRDSESHPQARDSPQERLPKEDDLTSQIKVSPTPSKPETDDSEKSQNKSGSSTQNRESLGSQVSSDSATSSRVVHYCDGQAENKTVAGNVAKKPDTFGVSWWGKKKENSLKNSKQVNKSNLAQSNNMKNLNSKNLQSNGSNTQSAIDPITSSHTTDSRVMRDVPTIATSTNAPYNSRIPGSSQTEKNSESHKFGSGWWVGNRGDNSNITPSSAAKHQTLSNPTSHPSNNKSGQHRQNNVSRSSTSVLSSTTSSNSKTPLNSPFSKRTHSTSVSNSNSTHTNSTFSNAQNNITSTNSACTSSTIGSSGDNNSPSNSQRNRRQSNSDTFGSGWWKHQAVDNSKLKNNADKPKTDCVSSKENKSKRIKEPDGQNAIKDCTFVNKCRDLVPYKTYITHRQLFRFAKVASHIASNLIRNEAVHGRILVMALLVVPGLWRASLGGSRISLVVEIIDRYPSQDHMLGVLIRDKHGHTAPVLLNTTETSVYNIPESCNIMSLPVSECLKPGTFIVLRAVKWHNLPNEKLGIVMMDMKLVSFIFYDLLK